MRMRSQQSNTVIVTQPRKQSGRGGYRPGAGRPKGGGRTAKPAQVSQGIRLIGVKREKQLWKTALEVAEETRNVDALIRALVHVNEIQRGRPYVATNPNAAPVQPQDNRMLMAIQNLQIVSQSPGQNGAGQAIETKAPPQLEAECQPISTNSDIEAPGVEPTSAKDHVEDVR